MKRHHGIVEIALEPTVGLDHDILHNIAGINAALHSPIHPQIDHPPQRLAVPFQQPVKSLGIALASLIEQLMRF